MEPVFILEASVRKVYGKKYDWWVLMQDAYLFAGKEKVIIPSGYETDFASAPRLVPDWLIPRAGLSAMPSTGHDYLCEYGIVPRREADRIFFWLLIHAGVPVWQAIMMYGYVRALGWVKYGALIKK